MKLSVCDLSLLLLLAEWRPNRIARVFRGEEDAGAENVRKALVRESGNMVELSANHKMKCVSLDNRSDVKSRSFIVIDC